MNHGNIVYDCMLHTSAARPIDAIGIYLVIAKISHYVFKIRAQVKNVVFVHNNLRLADKLQELSYTEATIQWETSIAEGGDDADAEPGEPDLCESDSSSD